MTYDAKAGFDPAELKQKVLKKLEERKTISSPEQRLARIADAHHKCVDAHGGTWGECNECGQSWPCPTHIWATTPRDPNATWDPSDDG